MRYLSCLLFMILMIAVTGCSQHPGITTRGEFYYPIPDQWRIVGKLAVRTELDSASVAIDWRQRGENYSIRVIGPFGQGSAEIAGNEQLISLQWPGQQPLVSTTPELLLKEALGWFLPIDDLRYWVQGVPNSDKRVDKPVYDEQGMLITFEQADWSINISRYKPVGKWLLPHRIKVNRDDVQLTLAIRQWQFL